MSKNIKTKKIKSEKNPITESQIELDLTDNNRMSGFIKGFGLEGRLSTMSEITLQIDAVNNKEEIYDILRNETKWLINFDVFAIAILNSRHTYYQMITLSPIADASGLNGSYFSVEEGLPGWVIKNQTPIISDAFNCPNHSNSLEGKFEELGIIKYLSVPIKSGKDKLGALIFGTSEIDNFSNEDLSIAQLFGLQIAVALSNTTFFEDAKKRITQIEIINEISGVLNSTLNIEELLNSTVEAVKRDFDYYNVMIFLISEDKKELALKSYAGSNIVQNISKRKINEGLSGWVIQKGELAVINDVSQDPRCFGYENHNIKSMLLIPIRIGDEIVGVIDIEDTKLYAFDDMDVIVLQTLTEQIASTLNNAKLYEEVKKANLKLKELDNLKSEFLGIVSHDFRSPLSSIILAGKSLLKNEIIQNSQRLKEYIQLIVDQGNRLNNLAEDTLSITKIESGQVSVASKVVNVERIIQDAITSVRLSNRHKVIYNVDPNVSFIKGDPAKLRQVLQNLLSNAVKYSPNGGLVTVEVTEHTAEEIIFEISDKGIGLKPEHIDRLFQKFSRVEDGEVKNIKGSGLGLWICKEIIEAHNGKIWVESEYGKGSIFKFTLKRVE